MDKITKGSRKNWFFSYNIIFDLEISGKAKLVYLYLCRCADEDGESFPSYRKIREKCNIGSDATISSTIKELEMIGLLTKEHRTNQNGGKTSNLYTIYDSPNIEESRFIDKPLLQSVKNPSTVSEEPLLQSVKNPSTVAVDKGLLIEGLPIIKDYQVKSSQSHKKNIKTDLTMTNDGDDIHTQRGSTLKNKEGFSNATAQSTHLESPLQNKSTDKNYTTYEECESIVKININYDAFIQERYPYIKLVDEIIFNMLDVLTTTDEFIKIKQQPKKTEIVKSVFLKLKYEHVLYVVEKFNNINYPIVHKGSYLKTLLYSSLEEMESYYQNEYRQGNL